MQRVVKFEPHQFTVMSGQPVVSAESRISVEGEVPGFAIYGPYVRIAAGVYEVEILSNIPVAGSAYFDVYAEGRMYGERDLSSSSRLIVRLFDTDHLEVRIKQAQPGFIFLGARIVPLLVDTEYVSLDDTMAIGRRLIAGSGESDAIFAVVDRLVGMHQSAQAQEIELEFINDVASRKEAKENKVRIDAQIFAIMRKAQGLSTPEFPELDFNITRSQIQEALSQTKIRIIDMVGISKEAINELIDLGYEPRFVDAIRLSRTHTGSLRHWQKLPGTVPPEPERRATQTSRQAELDLAFQMDLAFGRGLSARCPCSGRTLVSRHGFLQHMQGLAFLLYYFSGEEPFYLAFGGATGSKIFMYLPRTETILLLQDPALRWYSDEDVVRLFRVNVAANSSAVSSYLAGTTKATAVYSSNNMGHFIWNDIAGLQAAFDGKALAQIEQTVELNKQFLPVNQIFPEIEDLPSNYFKDQAEAFLYCINQSLLPIRFTDAFISETLCQRIYSAAKRNCSDGLSPPPPTGKPLIWINLRAHTKVWVEQAQHYIKIINSVAEDYGGVSIFFDGFDDVKPLIDQISLALAPSVICHEGLGMSLLDSINWAFAIDAYICPIGSGLVLVNWLANKPGVTHAEHGHMGQLEWWGTVREGGTLPLSPALSEIRDIGGGLYCNYEIEWTVILKLLRQALSQTQFVVSRSATYGSDAGLVTDGFEYDAPLGGDPASFVNK